MHDTLKPGVQDMKQASLLFFVDIDHKNEFTVALV